MSAQDSEGQVRAELSQLCRGRGASAPDLDTRLGPHLLALLDVRPGPAGTEGDSGPDAGPARDRTAHSAPGTRRGLRAEVTARLLTGVARLPPDLRLVAGAALGLEPSVRGRFLADRIRWLTEQLERDERTVRRRLGEALALLAEDLVTAAEGPVSAESTRMPGAPRPGGVPGSWYLARMSSLVRLEGASPEIYETRTVVATADGVAAIVLSLSLPRPRADLDGTGDGTEQATSGPRDLRADVLFGGVLTARERPSESLFRFEVRLPCPLAAGEAHRLAIRLTPTAGNVMADHYAFVPFTRCDEFRLRLRFSAARPPAGVWLLDGVPPRTADDDPAGPAEISVDPAGDCLLAFPAPSLGLSHGARWRWRS